MPSLAQPRETTSASDAPRDYARAPEVEAELGYLAGFSAQRLLSSLSAPGSKAQGRVREETLVCLTRAALRAGNDDLAWKILEILGKRVAGKLSRMSKLWCLDASIAEEVNDEMLVALYHHILDLTPAAQFWEARFWICFDRRFLSLMRRRREEEDRRLIPQDDQETGQPIDPFETVADPASAGARLHDPATRMLLADALSQLPEPIRAAYLLKHWCGYTEESVDPAQRETISALMGVSGRTVRNYLSKAETLLSQWRAGTGRVGRRFYPTAIGAEP